MSSNYANDFDEDDLNNVTNVTNSNTSIESVSFNDSITENKQQSFGSLKERDEINDTNNVYSQLKAPDSPVSIPPDGKYI